MIAHALAEAITYPAVGAALDIENVSHAFDIDGAALPVLEDVNLAIRPGEFVALLGPSGCGKSTLLRLVAGLEKPRAGVLREDDTRISRPHPSRVVVFQDPTLFPWRSVWDNVALGLEAQGILKSQRQRVDAALDLVGLSAFRNAYPHQLSGGMAQRVGARPRAGQRSKNPRARRAARQARFADTDHHAGSSRSGNARVLPRCW
jgi:NitT/TauT family transport system ATP-binding protein